MKGWYYSFGFSPAFSTLGCSFLSTHTPCCRMVASSVCCAGLSSPVQYLKVSVDGTTVSVKMLSEICLGQPWHCHFISEPKLITLDTQLYNDENGRTENAVMAHLRLQVP